MSAIEWTDVTWNPVRGCSRVSEGCRHCYAERMAARYSGPGLAFEGFAKHAGVDGPTSRPSAPRWTGRVELIPEKLGEPLRWRKPRRVFVNSMSDLFHERLSSVEIAAVFGIMACSSRHTFQVLTKRPDRMRQFCLGMERSHFQLMSSALMRAPVDYPRPLQLPQDWPLPNVWLGVSVEDQATADERIPLLLQTPAAKRFVSYEPALGPITLRTLVSANRIFRVDALAPHPAGLPKRWLDWVIVGGESGPWARPFDLAWARSVVRQCREAGVACFVKQLGARPFDSRIMCDHGAHENRAATGIHSSKGGDPAEWPEDLRVREFPR